MPNDSLLRPGRVKWLLFAWAVLTLLTSSRVVLSLEIKGYGEPLGAVLAGEALRWALWIPVIPLVLAVERRWGFGVAVSPLAIAIHIIGVSLVLLAHSVIMTVAGRQAGWYFALDSARATFLIQLVHEAAATVIVYGAIVASAHLRKHLRERDLQRTAHAGLEARLAEERLRVLQMQLHPHFLFNALHAIGGLVRDGERKLAVDTVSELGELLRRSLRNSDRPLVTLDEELEFVSSYLKIQQARYGERLEVNVSATEDARRSLVPTLILQPLVENAVRHGTAHAEAGGKVEIRASCSAGRLELVVSDDGPSPVEESDEPGIGLGNTRARLLGTYGSDFTFELSPDESRGTIARLSLPMNVVEFARA